MTVTILRVRVKPNAKQQRIHKGDAEWTIALPVAPEGGKANQALLKLLAQELGVTKSQIRIKSGHTSRHKLIEIEDAEPCNSPP